MPDCPFDPVQAERLRKLADRFRNAAPGYVSAGERALGEALDEALALLAGQAEQIERLTRERDEWKDAANMHDKQSGLSLAHAETVERQRDNLRDAAEAACIGLECAIKVHAAVVMDTPEDERVKGDAVAAMQLALDQALRRLRAAVGVETQQ